MFVIVDTRKQVAVNAARTWAEAGTIGGAFFTAGLTPVIIEVGGTRQQWIWNQIAQHWEPMPQPAESERLPASGGDRERAAK